MAYVLSEILSPSCIELELEGRRKSDIVRELAVVLSRGCSGIDVDVLTEEILEREKLFSTGLGGGIAIPHCLTEQVNETRIAFGRKLKGVNFDAMDKRPVNLFLLLVGPAGDHSRHIQVLSKIARYLNDESFRRQLLEAKTPSAVIGAFRDKEKS
jgi:mannitol/fructose-specific phosphotransferase system IIA component (Ntr-type)